MQRQSFDVGGAQRTLPIQDPAGHDHAADVVHECRGPRQHRFGIRQPREVGRGTGQVSDPDGMSQQIRALQVSDHGQGLTQPREIVVGQVCDRKRLAGEHGVQCVRLGHRRQQRPTASDEDINQCGVEVTAAPPPYL